MKSTRGLVAVLAVAASLAAARPVAAVAVVPTQLVAKAYTEVLGRAPTQTEWASAVAAFETSGCDAATAGAFVRARFLSAEYAGLGYDDAARALTVFKGVFDREPDQAGYDATLAALEAGTSLAAVVDAALASAEFTDSLVPRICGASPGYGSGRMPAIPIPVSGAGFAGGTGDQLQALLDATPPGGTVVLAQKALVRVQFPLAIPAGVTLTTAGDPGPTRYASMGRLVRAAQFPGEVVTVHPGARLDSVWVDGQRGVPPRVAVGPVGTPSLQPLADNGLGQGGYLLTARNTPGITNTINVSLLGGGLTDTVQSNTSGWTAIQTGTQDGSTCQGLLTNNLITAYSSDHGTVFSDGISNYCDAALIEHNTVVDATDVPIILFPPSSLGPQQSQVRFNTILNAGNNAYGGLVADGTLSNKTAPPSFVGSLVHDNVLWSGPRTHFDIAISVGTRAWFGPNSATSFGAAFRDNTTGSLSARVATGIAVSGMLMATVQDNALTISFAPEASPCPRLAVGAQVSTGHASGDIQPYEDAIFDSCITTGQ